MSTILKALCAVQRDLAAAGIAKSDTNTFDNYKFRGIDAVLNTLAPILSEHGVIIMPSVVESDIRTGTSAAGKPQHHAKVKVEYTLYDSEGAFITHTFHGEGMDRGDKAINKACTAAFKYFIFEAFCIPVEGTPDADTESPEVGVDESPEMIEAGEQLNTCLENDDYLGAAEIYDEWNHEQNLIICRAPSKGGSLSNPESSQTEIYGIPRGMEHSTRYRNMSYQHKDGFGSLFRNRKKEKDTQPDMRGDCMINGQEMEIAGWTKKDKNGNSYLSLKIQDKREQQEQGMQQARQAAEPGGFESEDIPF